MLESALNVAADDYNLRPRGVAVGGVVLCHTPCVQIHLAATVRPTSGGSCRAITLVWTSPVFCALPGSRGVATVLFELGVLRAIQGQR